MEKYKGSEIFKIRGLKNLGFSEENTPGGIPIKNDNPLIKGGEDL